MKKPIVQFIDMEPMFVMRPDGSHLENKETVEAYSEMVDILCNVYLDYQLENVSYSTHNTLSKVITVLKKAGVEL